MKIAQALMSALVGAVVLNLAASAHAQSIKQFATIVRIEGEARYTLDGDWSHAHPLVAGKVLEPGSIIQTAVNSQVDIVIGDKVTSRIVAEPSKIGPAADSNVRGWVSYKAQSVQNVVRLKGDTVLAIDKLSASNMGVDATTDTELDLQKGTILGDVKKLSAASTYQIRTPNGMAAIRGTTFALSATGLITVTKGSCYISINGQPAQLVNPGQQFDPTTGQITTLTPEQLTYAQDTAVLTITVEHGIISFANDQTTIFVSPNNSGITGGGGGGGGGGGED